MFSSPEEVLKYIADEGVEFVDVRFIDLPGIMQHFTMPAAAFDASAFEDGQMFDGSSIRGFQAIHESDMKLIPDPATAYIDPYRVAKTLVITHSIVDPFTAEPYSRDPRQVAAKAEAVPQGHRHRRHRVLRPRGRVLRLRRRPVRDQAQQRLLRDRLHRGAVEHRTPGGGRQPRLQDAVQERLLPRVAHRPPGRPA